MKKIKNQAHAFPDFEILKKDNPSYNSLVARAINYANYSLELDDLKKETVLYSQRELKSNIPLWEYYFIGKLCWLSNNGVEIDTKDLDDRIQNLIDKYDSIQAPIAKIVINENFAQLEEVIDNLIFKDLACDYISQLEFLKDAKNLRQIKNYIQEQLNGITNDDLEVIEYFDRWSTKEKNRIIEIFNYILSISGNKTQPETKPVNKKISVRKIVPSKLVKKIKYLKECKELKIRSVHPEKIVFAKNVWIFNVKTKKLQHYVSATDKGLLVRGTTILNFDEKLSMSKIIRKPEEILNKLSSLGKVEQRKFMSEIKAVGQPLRGRLTEDCLIVKVS